jgi:conjugal transfer pilus assembly protein TraW
MRLKRIIPCLIGVALVLSTGLSQAEDIGKYGNVWDIQEQDAIDTIKGKLTKMQDSGQLKKFEDAYRNRQIQYIENPPPVPGLTTVTQTRVWTYDPTYTFQDTVHDNLGNVLVPAGSRVNPLDYTTLSKSILFIDGRDPKQLAFAKHDIDEHPRDKVVLVAGSYLKLTREWQRPVYFDQRGALTHHFGITRVPSILSQKGHLLQVKEVAL